MLKYDNLDYPLFKVNILNSRINDNNKKNKEPCLEKLRAWEEHLMGYHHNYNKVFNRSLETFMFKSLSEKRLFSYFLRHQDYSVTKMGKILKRIDRTDVLPFAVVEKKLSSERTLIKVNKVGKKGLAIGCGILKLMEKKGFNNCYKTGFFLHSKGLIFT